MSFPAHCRGFSMSKQCVHPSLAHPADLKKRKKTNDDKNSNGVSQRPFSWEF